MATRPHEARLGVTLSKAVIAFSEGKGASVRDLLKLADDLAIPYEEVAKLRFDEYVCRQVADLTRIRAVHLLAYALGPMAELAKRDPAAFKALAMVAGVKGGALVQLNQVIDARLPEPAGARGFIENFRKQQRNGALRLLDEKVPTP